MSTVLTGSLLGAGLTGCLRQINLILGYLGVSGETNLARFFILSCWQPQRWEQPLHNEHLKQGD
jgi:hypothetical protein